MPDKAVVAELNKAKQMLKWVAGVAALATIGASYLTDENHMTPAWHRQLLSFADWCVFSLIATVCTLICIRCVLRAFKLIKKMIDEDRAQREEQRQKDIDEAARKAAAAVIDAIHVKQLSDTIRRRGDHGLD